MKVKEYIEYLQALDQDKDIYVVYYGFWGFDPVADEVADDDCTRKDGTFEYRKGDYLIKAG
jgi:hypothetical protein